MVLPGVGVQLRVARLALEAGVNNMGLVVKDSVPSIVFHGYVAAANTGESDAAAQDNNCCHWHPLHTHLPERVDRLDEYIRINGYKQGMHGQALTPG